MTEETAHAQDYQLIDMDLVDSPTSAARFSPDDPALSRLAQSIHTLGLLQPIVVRPVGDRFRLVAGQRRIRAFRMLGKTHIPAHILPFSDPDEALATVTENLQRQQLLPLEEAAALQDLLDNHDITQADLAGLLGVDRTWISHRLQLLRMPEDLMDAMVYNNLAPSLAIELMRITEDEDRRYYLNMVVTAGATLATVRDWVRAWVIYRIPEPTEEEKQATKVDVPPPVKPPPPSCLVCGEEPPRVQLRVSYLCWTCERALRNMPREGEQT